jgi:hypothetical protein
MDAISETLPVKSEPVLAEPESWGPAMAALPSDRHRAFVLALFEVKPGYGANVAAAKLAGFGKPTSTAKTMSVIACRPGHDPRILDAMHETGLKIIRNSAPGAIRALNKMIANPRHKDHARAVAAVLDRHYPIESVHRVEVDHRYNVEVPTAEVLARIAELARAAGLDPTALPPTIDGTCEDITDKEQTQ